MTTGVSGLAETTEKATTGVSAAFSWKSTPLGPALESHLLRPLAPHLFTSRACSFRRPAEQEDYARLSAWFGLSAENLVLAKQVHGRALLFVRPGEPLVETRDADAIISTDPGRAIAIRVADCVPLLIADSRQRVVAAIHAGWRGTCAGIVAATIQAISELGIDAAELTTAIGPSIGACCYQVDDRVRNAFLGITPDAIAWFTGDGPDHWKLDLWQANADQLEAAGVPRDAIQIARYCSAEHLDNCFSYRAEGPGTGRMVAAIRLVV